MILKYDTSFNLSFPVGKKYVIGQFHLKSGEEVSSAVDQFINEYDIPCYFRISLLNSIENLIKQDKIITKDNDDIEILLDQQLLLQQQEEEEEQSEQEQSIIMNTIEQLSNQYNEKIQYWNKLTGSKESEEQQQQQERISTFLYLVDKNSDTRERIINQEELFATETSILLVKKQDDLKQLNEKHSQEMEDAFRNSYTPDQVELIVAQNMEQVDEFDRHYSHEIAILKHKQKLEFAKFLNDLYWLEKTKDDLDEIESFNQQQQQQSSSPSPPQQQQQLQQNNQQQQSQLSQSQQLPQQSSIIDSIGQNLDRGVARASSFFSFGFKKNQTPVTSPPATPQLNSDNTNDINNTPTKPIGINSNKQQQQPQDNQTSPPNSFNSKTSSSPLKSNVQNTINSNNNTTPQRKGSTGSNSSSVGSTITNLINSNNNNNSNNNTTGRKQSFGNQPTTAIIPPLINTSRNEEFTIAVGVQKKKIFKFKLIEESPLQLCRPITSTTGEFKKSKRVDYIKTLYSDSLSAVVLIIDPSLEFNTENEKKFIKYCNMSTELHFDSIDTQIYNFKQSLLKESGGVNTKLCNGDFFITKHSNLSDVQVVFHLVIDSKNRTPLGGISDTTTNSTTGTTTNNNNNNNTSSLPTTNDISKGLRNIILTASKYGIGNLTIPICLTESELDLNITNPNLLSRCVSVLSVTRASLTSLQEMTSIKTVQFSLPPQLDSGNTSFKGPISQKWKSAINPFLYLNY